MVEEIPLYQPCGQGEHLYLWVEKVGISTGEILSRASRVFGLKREQIGHAGRKDQNSVSRQWISLHTDQNIDLHHLESDQLKILDTGRHTNKLKTGHLKGNNFKICVREIESSDNLEGVIETLNSTGFPNYFGVQRLGIENNNAVEGKELLVHRNTKKTGSERCRFQINAYQSLLFNRLISMRILSMGNLSRVMEGDLLVLHPGRSYFLCELDELAQSQARAEKNEISASAPLFGYKVEFAGGKQGEWEKSVLNEENIALNDFKFPKKSLSAKGERRPIRAFPRNFSHHISPVGKDLCLNLEFTLDKGIYATSLLRELLKNDTLSLS